MRVQRPALAPAVVTVRAWAPVSPRPEPKAAPAVGSPGGRPDGLAIRASSERDTGVAERWRARCVAASGGCPGGSGLW
jgi:hypothetical protein